LLIQVKPGRVVGNQEHQICRSASPWSIGASERECSIHNAYQKLIEESQNFIYIENQFFMGQENQVTQSMANRIRKAHLNRENFKVIVVMPLLPGFEGSVTDTKNGPLRIQVHNQF
jgi:phospholipase D1/2